MSLPVPGSRFPSAVAPKQDYTEQIIRSTKAMPATLELSCGCGAPHTDLWRIRCQYKKSTDFAFVLGDEHVRAHSAVIMGTSKVVERMVTSNFKNKFQYAVEGFSSVVVKKFVALSYGLCVKVKLTEMNDLLRFADSLLAPSISALIVDAIAPEQLSLPQRTVVVDALLQVYLREKNQIAGGHKKLKKGKKNKMRNQKSKTSVQVSAGDSDMTGSATSLDAESLDCDSDNELDSDYGIVPDDTDFVSLLISQVKELLNECLAFYKTSITPKTCSLRSLFELLNTLMPVCMHVTDHKRRLNHLKEVSELLISAFYRGAGSSFRELVTGLLDRKVLRYLVEKGFGDGSQTTSPRALLAMSWVDPVGARKLIPDVPAFLSQQSHENLLHVFQPIGVFSDYEIIAALKEVSPPKLPFDGPADVELTCAQRDDDAWRQKLTRNMRVDVLHQSTNTWVRCMVVNVLRQGYYRTTRDRTHGRDFRIQSLQSEPSQISISEDFNRFSKRLRPGIAEEDRFVDH
ncbi:MAG: hypothetical protein MHM6MM_005099 [Cercozoa sp. M6MM]